MSFSPKVKIITKDREIKAVMLRQAYTPRGGNRKKRFRWIMADYTVEETISRKGST